MSYGKISLLPRAPPSWERIDFELFDIYEELDVELSPRLCLHCWSPKWLSINEVKQCLQSRSGFVSEVEAEAPRR